MSRTGTADGGNHLHGTRFDGPVVQAGAIHGSVAQTVHQHTYFVSHRGGAEIAHRPRARSDLAVRNPRIDHIGLSPRLRAMWSAAAGAGSGPLVLNVRGPAGSGRTTCAQVLGHSFARRAGVDGRVRSVSLRGGVRAAAEQLLRDAGVDEQHWTDDPVAVYQDVTRGRAQVLILEDVSVPGAVADLLPQHPGSLAIVVTGAPLDPRAAAPFGGGPEPPVSEIALHPLGLDDAVDLLHNEMCLLRPARSPDEERLRAALASDAARLPKAVTERAALMLRSDCLEDSVTPTPETAYGVLDGGERALIRALEHCPGGAGPAVLRRALRGRHVGETLDELAALGLVVREERGDPGAVRYRLAEGVLPVLEAARARGDGGADPRTLALTVCAAYHDFALDASLRLSPERKLFGEDRTAPRRFGDESAALEWARAEREGVAAAAQRAAELGEPDLACRILQALWALLLREGRYGFVVDTHAPVLALADGAHVDPLLLAKVALQYQYGLAERFPDDAERLAEGDRWLERASTLAGGALQDALRAGPDGAAEAAEAHHALATALEMRAGAGRIRARLAAAADDAAAADRARAQARADQERALEEAAASGDLRALTVQRLKYALLLIEFGASGAARPLLEQAAAGADELDDDYNRGRAAMELGRIAGDPAEAERLYGRALVSFTGGHPRREADVLLLRGRLLRDTGRRAGAARDFARACELYFSVERNDDAHRAHTLERDLADAE